ncbi:MAG: universal stress protein [Gammaproteobacteria bacterium]|nr:universal stress protein [Gammaproteobacteria bacterium]
MKTQRILAPVDGSEMSRFALMEADVLASQSGGALTLMFVHEPATVHLMDDEFPEPVDMTNALLATARNCMQKLVATLTTPVANRHIVIERGSPAQTIVDHSRKYDLIVMSTHGHTGMKHLHLGSVAERVVRGSHCDVLVVKQPSDTTD